jgi:hypothetical protein
VIFRAFRKHLFPRFLVTLACAYMFTAAYGRPRKEFLTEQEIEIIQANREINIRVKVYLGFALSRLKAAEERLTGKESAPGDPFEFFTVEDMLNGYYRIFESVMINLEDAYEKSDPIEMKKVRSALKTLKKDTETAIPQLEILKKIAEEKDKEELWDLVNKAIEISNGAHEGAETALSKETDEDEKATGRK